jgi:hypothetical protein
MPLLNTRLMSNPMNWLTILLMLFVAGIFGHYLLSLFDQDPAGAKKLVTPSLSTEQLSASQQGTVAGE